MYCVVVCLHIYLSSSIICTQVYHYIHTMLCYKQAEMDTINFDQQKLI